MTGGKRGSEEDGGWGGAQPTLPGHRLTAPPLLSFEGLSPDLQPRSCSPGGAL